MPEVRVAPINECADIAARLVLERIHAPDAVIGPATGRSMVALHARLTDAHRAGIADLGRARWLMLDELLDIDPDDPRGYRATLMRDLLSIPGTRATLIGPRLELGDADAICRDFHVASHGVTPSLQLLGLGRTGHVGFNEPGSLPDSRIRIADLAESTCADADPHEWPGHTPPRRAITRGVADIADADTIVVLAFGAAKAAAVRDMLTGAMSPECPASLLRSHPDLRVLLDDEAARWL
ncbi:MAG: 6-phosphogluconolactonase [Actinomycetota bacterium]